MIAVLDSDRAPDPVTSPVCVALVTFAVLAATDVLLPTSVSKSEIVAAVCVPVWLALASRVASALFAVAPSATFSRDRTAA